MEILERGDMTADKGCILFHRVTSEKRSVFDQNFEDEKICIAADAIVSNS